MDVEPVFVDQVVAGELRAEVAAANDEVPAGLCLEGEHFGRHDVVDDRRVPTGPLQGARVDDLRHVPPDLRELDDRRGGGRVVVGGRPELLHQLVGDPPFEKAAGAG